MNGQGEGEGEKVRWEPKGCVGSTAFGCFQPGQGGEC